LPILELLERENILPLRVAPVDDCREGFCSLSESELLLNKPIYL
jgi:hypothetical protein